MQNKCAHISVCSGPSAVVSLTFNSASSAEKMQLCITLADLKGITRDYAGDYPGCFLEAVLHLCCIFWGVEVVPVEDKDLLYYVVLLSNIITWSQLLNTLSNHCETLQGNSCATAGKRNGPAKCIVSTKEIVAKLILLVNIIFSTSFLLLLLRINTGTSDAK